MWFDLLFPSLQSVVWLRRERVRPQHGQSGPGVPFWGYPPCEQRWWGGVVARPPPQPPTPELPWGRSHPQPQEVSFRTPPPPPTTVHTLEKLLCGKESCSHLLLINYLSGAQRWQTQPDEVLKCGYLFLTNPAAFCFWENCGGGMWGCREKAGKKKVEAEGEGNSRLKYKSWRCEDCTTGFSNRKVFINLTVLLESLVPYLKHGKYSCASLLISYPLDLKPNWSSWCVNLLS